MLRAVNGFNIAAEGAGRPGAAASAGAGAAGFAAGFLRCALNGTKVHVMSTRIAATRCMIEASQGGWM
jgi:hypothetical protein